MVWGYHTQYLSTIFKGPFATALKERFEARRAINNLRASDKKLYKDLPSLVEKEHRVSKALSEESKVIMELKKAAANGYSLAFNASTMDMKTLEAVNKLIEAWTKLNQLAKNNPQFEQLSRLFVTSIQKAIKKAELEERGEYKDVMIIVDESEKKDHSQFMQMVRLKFQTLESQSWLAKLAIRKEIRIERRVVEGIGGITKKCSALVRDIEKGPKKIDIQKILNAFEKFANESKYYIEQAFYQAHLIKKRDFLLILKVIVNTNVLKQLNQKWVRMHFMPELPTKEKELKIDDIEKKISKEFHTIAQALRISIAGIQKIESKLARAA